jgi:Ca2+-binding EF-hand superfamily protein
MKTSTVSPLLLTALLLAVPALAQNEMNPSGKDAGASGEMKKNHQEMIKKYDQNGDGRLDDDEKAAAHAAMRKGDGKKGAAKKGSEGERRKQWLERFDKDGDGKLNAAERSEAEKAREQMGPKGGTMREEMVKRFDKDGDGKLNEAERAEAQKPRAKRKAGSGSADAAKPSGN